ncbi:MAG: Trk system potassium transporter TrkA [Acidimicrobiales bacterium]|nr:Trk system potassium transporter TrkA [Acidimicrobiales bacterium]
MYVVVVGAGEVGVYITRLLTDPKHQLKKMEVAVIDHDPGRIDEIESELNATMVLGSGSHPSVLSKAEISRADLLVAVTPNDEVNLIASLYARNQGVRKTIVRIEADEFKSVSDNDDFFFGVLGPDLVFDPDEDTAKEIAELLRAWGAEELAILCDGEVAIMGVTLSEDAEFCGQTLSAIGERYEPEWSFLVAALQRDGETTIPRSEETLQDGDRLWLVIKKSERSNVLESLGFKKKKHRRVLLLGGGRTAEYLAQKLVEMRFREVTLVEQDKSRAAKLATRLDGVDVVNGDISDAQFLSSEVDAGKYDAAIALTGKDEANVLSCMYAKSLGVERTITILHRLKLLKLLGLAGVDSALSPVTASANRVLSYVHEVDDVATFLGADQNFEVAELEVEEGSAAAASTLKDLGLPKEALVGAYVRDGVPLIGRGTSQLFPGDHVLLIARPERIDAFRDFFLSADKVNGN